MYLELDTTTYDSTPVLSNKMTIEITSACLQTGWYTPNV